MSDLDFETWISHRGLHMIQDLEFFWHMIFIASHFWEPGDFTVSEGHGHPLVKIKGVTYLMSKKRQHVCWLLALRYATTLLCTQGENAGRKEVKRVDGWMDEWDRLVSPSHRSHSEAFFSAQAFAFLVFALQEMRLFLYTALSSELSTL